MRAAPLNGAEWKNRMSMSGSRRRRSKATSAAVAMAPTTNMPMINGEVQPRRGPSMMPPVIEASSTTIRT